MSLGNWFTSFKTEFIYLDFSELLSTDAEVLFRNVFVNKKIFCPRSGLQDNLSTSHEMRISQETYRFMK